MPGAERVVAALCTADGPAVRTVVTRPKITQSNTRKARK
jgi:hypothetical protein